MSAQPVNGPRRGPEQEAEARAAADAAVQATFFGPERVDDLARTVLALAREVWVLRDRQRVLEAVLEEKGVAVADAVERYQPGPELRAKLEAERKAFVQGLLQQLAPGRE